jgi:hypothetical protein
MNVLSSSITSCPCKPTHILLSTLNLNTFSLFSSIWVECQNLHPQKTMEVPRDNVTVHKHHSTAQVVDTHTTVINSGHTDCKWPQQTNSLYTIVSLQHHPNNALNSYHDTSSWVTCWPPAVVLRGFNVWAWWQFAPKLPKSHLLYKASDRLACSRFNLLR